MRVMLVTGEYPPDEGGVADYTRCLAEALVAEGVEVVIATSGGVRTTAEVEAIHGPIGLDLKGKTPAETAVAILTPLAAQASRDPEFLSVLGETQWRTGNVQAAERFFKEVIDIDDEHVDAYNNLGLMFAKQDRLSEAVIQ